MTTPPDWYAADRAYQLHHTEINSQQEGNRNV